MDTHPTARPADRRQALSVVAMRPSRVSFARRFTWLVLCVCTGCFNLPEFAQESMVDRPRILAVVADPPEVTPGDSVTLQVLVAGAQEISAVRWLACSTVRSFTASTQYGENTDDRGCAGDAIELGAGQRATLAAPATMSLFLDDDRVRAALGGEALSASALDAIRTQVGVAFTIEVEVMADGKRLRGLKRVLVSENQHPGQNPPPPELRFGDKTLSSVGDAPPYQCEPNEGGLRVAPGERVALSPLFNGGVEPWLEDYTVLDARGVPSARHEQAFYSWYTTAGKLEAGTTEAPDRGNTWSAPQEPGCARLWLVVRDGHGGQNACGMRVAVGDGDDCGSE